MRGSGGVPEEFVGAYEGLMDLVGRVETGEIGEQVLDEEVDVWRREDCRGAVALTRTALYTLRYQVASKGLEADTDVAAKRERAQERVRVLSRIESILDGPPQEKTAEPAGIVEVALPEDMRHEAPAARGFRMGELQIIFEPK